MEKTINIELAIKEVNDWLDYKNVRPKRREGLKEHSEAIAEAIADGVLSIDKDKNIVHKLIIPFGEEHKVQELKYKPRINDSMKIPHMKGVANNDASGMLHATIATLTGEPRAVVAKMDMEDMDIARNIAVFFI